MDMATIVEQLLLHKGSHVHCVDPISSVRDAVAILGENRIGAVMVCQGKRVLGILSERDCTREVLWRGSCTLDTPVSVVSIGDVINSLLREQQSLIESLESYISGSPSVRPPAH
jgi:CBS domain-containing protein